MQGYHYHVLHSQRSHQCARSKLVNARRKWIYIGLFYNVGMSLILTATTAAALRFIHPPKDRPTLGTDKKELAEKATALQPRASFVTRMLCSLPPISQNALGK